MDLDLEPGNVLNSSTWEFPRPGWWLAHAALIGGAIYLGYRLARRD